MCSLCAPAATGNSLNAGLGSISGTEVAGLYSLDVLVRAWECSMQDSVKLRQKDGCVVSMPQIRC